jgi:hypothetical protein
MRARESFERFFLENPMRQTVRDRIERLNPEGIWLGRMVRGLDYKPMSWRRAKRRLIDAYTNGRKGKFFPRFRTPSGKETFSFVLQGPWALDEFVAEELGIRL